MTAFAAFRFVGGIYVFFFVPSFDMICNNLKRYVSCMLYVCSSSSVVLIVPGHAREIANRLEKTECWLSWWVGLIQGASLL